MIFGGFVYFSIHLQSCKICLWLISVFAENIRMCSGSDKHKLACCKFVNQQPVWLNVAFPMANIVTGKHVVFDLRR